MALDFSWEGLTKDLKWGDIFGAVGSIGSALIGSNAADKAADAGTEAADKSLATQWAMYEQNRADLAPYRAAGTNALGQLSAGLPNWQQDPGSQFRMQQGVDALDRSAASRGMLLSGAQQKAVQQYGQNLGSQEFGNAWNRQASLAGIGQTATNTGVSAGQSAATGMGAAYTNAGLAAANGALGAAESSQNALANLAYMYGGRK